MKKTIFESYQETLAGKQIDEASTAFDKFFEQLTKVISKAPGGEQDKLSDALVAWAVKFPNSYKKAAKLPIPAELFEAVWMGTDTTPQEISDL